jgi:hypothetical protein
MKTSFKGFTVTFFFLLISANLLMGQTKKNGQIEQTDKTEFKLKKTIDLVAESGKVEIKIPVSEKKNGLSIKISSEIFKGELTIEIYDPTDEKMGNYTVGSQNSIKVVGKTYNPTQSEPVAGEITKVIEFPKIGTWTVNVIPKNAVGKISLESIQYSFKR